MREISFFKERILQYLEYKGIKKYECYKNTGITNGVLSQKNGLSEDNIMRFFSYYKDINPVWFITGEGNMLIDDNTQQPINDDIEGLKRLIKAQETIIELQKENAALKAEKERLTAENCQMKINLSKTITPIKREPQR